MDKLFCSDVVIHRPKSSAYLFAFKNLLKFPFYPLDSDVGHDAVAYLMYEIRSESASRVSGGFA